MSSGGLTLGGVFLMIFINILKLPFLSECLSAVASDIEKY